MFTKFLQLEKRYEISFYILNNLILRLLENVNGRSYQVATRASLDPSQLINGSAVALLGFLFLLSQTQVNINFIFQFQRIHNKQPINDIKPNHGGNNLTWSIAFWLFDYWDTCWIGCWSSRATFVHQFIESMGLHVMLAFIFTRRFLYSYILISSSKYWNCNS